MTQPLTIPLSSIIEGDRARKDYGDISGLTASLKSLGSIHPIVLSLERDGSHRLVAGGRRLRAMQAGGFSEVTHGSILVPGTVAFLYRDEIPQDVLKHAELDENLFRLAPKWQEDVLLIADVHALKRNLLGSGEWGVEQTAALLGKGYGKTKVNNAVRVAKEIRAGNKAVADAENLSDAVAVLCKQAEDKGLAELHRRAGLLQSGSTSGFLDTLSINLGGKKGGDAGMTVGNDRVVPLQSGANVLAEGSALAVQPSGAPVEIPLSKMFVLGDCITIMPTLPAASFDHIVTDIPYGIDMKNLDTRDMSAVAAEHDVSQNVSMMEPFLRESFRLVRSGGFCVFFFDLDWYEYLVSTAEMIGWKVQRWPLIAYKTSSCQNNAAQYNFTKNYECAMVLRRDEKTVLRSQQPTSLWMGDFAAERKLYANPFAKPFSLWKWIFDAIAFPGQTILDPFCGEMSSSRAAINCGLTPFGIELNESHFNRGLLNVQGAYALVHKDNVRFV